MGTFLLTGDYDNGDGVFEFGTAIATPSVLPLVEVNETSQIGAPIQGKVDKDLLVMELPSSDTYFEPFTLDLHIRLNSGREYRYTIDPLPEGSMLLLESLTPVSPGA